MPQPLSLYVESALTPHSRWKHQSFEYYAAHFLVGSGMTGGDLDGSVRALANAMQKQYEVGVEHGQASPKYSVAK